MKQISFSVSNNTIKLNSNNSDVLNEIKMDWFTKAHLPGFKYLKETRLGHMINIILDKHTQGSDIMVNSEGKKWKLSVPDRNIRARDIVLLSLQVSTYLNELHNIFTAHASFIKKRSTGVLLCGGTGSGKTLFSVAASMKGWEIVSNEFTSFNSNFENTANILNIHLDRNLVNVLGTKDVDIGFKSMLGVKVKLIIFLKLYEGSKLNVKEILSPNKYFYLYETFSRITKAVDNLMTDRFDIPYLNLEDKVSSRNRSKFVKDIADNVRVISIEGNYRKAISAIDHYL